MLSDELLRQLAEYEYSVARGGDRVYKDECIYCFETPMCESGLYVCLSTLLGTCSCHLPLHVNKTGKRVFLNIKKVPVEVDLDAEEEGPPDKKPTKMAIGMEGGFDIQTDKIEYDQQNYLTVTNKEGAIETSIRLPDSAAPLKLQLSIAAVLSHQGVNLVEDVQAWQEKREVSKYATNLVQLNNGVIIPPSGWKCAMCDLTQNLWMNLTDGTILCGRKYFDGTGGNNHAVTYYDQTRFPLAVKLGTIGPDGGDVYSYDEDDMVEDPKLTQHLKHFGINVTALEKTDKTMTELEIEANLSLKAEWDLIQESGKKLAPCYGSGYTGMINLGNSCYMNSVVQVLFSIREFISTFTQLDTSEQLFHTAEDVPRSFPAQMTKLACGLLSDKHSRPPKTDEEDPIPQGIRPHMFKTLAGRGHPEFSTNHQQDAHEYFLHMLSLIETSYPDLKLQFAFQFTDRYECSSSKKVAYKKREELCWSLPVPLDSATNIEEHRQFEQKRLEAQEKGKKLEIDEIVRLNVPMQVCVDAFLASEHINDFYSEAIKAKTIATKLTKFSSFPDYLVVQMRRFTIGEDWAPKKLDVSIEVAQTLDLNGYRCSGLQPHEQKMPDEESATPSEPEINEGYVSMLVDMGFPREACRKAVHFTSNQGVEAAMNWVFEHNQDEDFATPLILASGTSAFIADAEALTMIVTMGFTEQQAKIALEKTNNNLEAAAEWIFTHPDELNGAPTAATNQLTSEPTSNYKDGDGKYELFAFISHMGTSTSCGHYVCHIHKEGRWVIYNDRKVAISEAPPIGLGYIYFYRRTSS